MTLAQNICEPHGGVEYAHRTVENDFIVYCKNKVSVNATSLRR
jgi:hypothetical protein